MYLNRCAVTSLSLRPCDSQCMKMARMEFADNAVPNQHADLDLRVLHMAKGPLSQVAQYTCCLETLNSTFLLINSTENVSKQQPLENQFGTEVILL